MSLTQIALLIVSILLVVCMALLAAVWIGVAYFLSNIISLIYEAFDM